MKKLITSRHLTLALSGILLWSCSANSETDVVTPVTEQKVSVDSLVNEWNTAWNANDTLAISEMFNANSVMLSGEWKVVGKDEIMTKWVNGQLQTVANLQSTKVTEEVTSDMALYTGFWTLDQTSNDSIVGTSKGNFSAVWKKQEDNSWKIALMHMANTGE
jgi:uncharacterized protein (TIGR02246 family)